jgi:glycosyltransferase involved in cell wall biosynthesis
MTPGRAERVAAPSPVPNVTIRQPPLDVLILTRNEEDNLSHALASVAGLAAAVWVVDSHSTDRTASIADAAGARVVTHDFTGYPAQRNWALRNLPFTGDWVLVLDADETVSPELAAELPAALAAAPPDLAGFYLKRRFIFLGRWLRHGGYYPVWLLRVMRHRTARCEERAVDEHFVVEGRTARLRHDLLHEDRRPLSRWVERHDQYATLAAETLARAGERGAVAGRWTGTQAERKRWWYDRVYRRAPVGLRAVAYFLYRYLLRGGFLDGREGFLYHLMQGLWYRALIDAKLLELRRRAPRGHAGAPAVRAPDPAPEP